MKSQVALRANTRGTLLAAGGTVFARNQTGGSYALVRTGDVSGVAIKREHCEAGVTRSKGYLLVENISAQVPVSFEIDADKLAADALAIDTGERIVVPRGAVGLVQLNVVHFRPRTIQLLDMHGVPLAAGSMLTAQPSGEQVMVGFDRMAQFNSAGRDTRLLARRSGSACIAEVDPRRIAALSADAPPAVLQCRAQSALRETILAAAEVR